MSELWKYKDAIPFLFVFSGSLHQLSSEVQYLWRRKRRRRRTSNRQAFTRGRSLWLVEVCGVIWQKAHYLSVFVCAVSASSEASGQTSLSARSLSLSVSALGEKHVVSFLFSLIYSLLVSQCTSSVQSNACQHVNTTHICEGGLLEITIPVFHSLKIMLFILKWTDQTALQNFHRSPQVECIFFYILFNTYCNSCFCHGSIY